MRGAAAIAMALFAAPALAEPIPVPEDGLARYALVSLGDTPDGLVRAKVMRKGSMAESFMVMDIDCAGRRHAVMGAGRDEAAVDAQAATATREFLPFSKDGVDIIRYRQLQHICMTARGIDLEAR